MPGRVAYIAVVDIYVKEGSEDAFIQASLANAQNSVKEPTIIRFDVCRSAEDKSRFALVEIYTDEKGPADHKATAHFNAWREGVADMMAKPRNATQWDTILPVDAVGFTSGEKVYAADAAPVEIAHVLVSVKPGTEDAFIVATTANASASVQEPENLRFDFLRSMDDPTKFLLIEIYRTAEGSAAHKQTEHYLKWRETVADMMASPRVGSKYQGCFPSLPVGWKSSAAAPVSTTASRTAYIAVVDIRVKEGCEEAFIKASLANAQASSKEPMIARFDLVQSVEDKGRFALVEIYTDGKGPPEHKATPHYLAWFDGVADMMAQPRSATQWDTILPAAVADFRAGEKTFAEGSTPFDVAHVLVSVKPGTEDAFIQATIANASESVKEADNLRFDFLRSVGDPTKFMLVEVYRTKEGSVAHKQTEHYLKWRDTVADMMAVPRVGTKFQNRFPSSPEGWKL